MAFVIYGTASCIFFARTGVFTGGALIGGGADPTIFAWCLAWWPYALTHGVNPFITHMVWAPSGINLTWATSVPSLALLAWPLTALWGPATAFNIVTLAAPTLAAFGAFVLCYEITAAFFPSLVGGWFFGFSSYEMAQLLGHLHITFVVCVPLLLWLTVLRYKRAIARWPYVIATGAMLAFQLGISTEILATMSLFLPPALMFSYIFCQNDRARILQITKEIIGAYIVCLVLVSPFLYFFFSGMGRVPSLFQPFNIYVADALNYVIPTPITAIGGSWATFIARTFTGNYSEEDAYLGVLVLAMLGMSAYSLRSHPWVRVIVATLVTIVIFSFGPSLHVMGRGVMHLPWFLIQKLPLLKNALPGRLTLYVSLMIALLLSLWLASLRGPQIWRRYLLAGLAAVSLLPSVFNGHDIWLQKNNTPMFFRDLHSNGVLKRGATVVALPYGYQGSSMLWQATSGMYFRMAGGYLQAFVPKPFAPWPAVRIFYSGPVPGYRTQIAAFCVAHRVDAIIIGPGARKTWMRPLDRLGWPQKDTGGVTIFNVPPSVVHSYKDATANQMEQAAASTQFRALKIASACYLSKGFPLAALTPYSAESDGCLNRAYGGFPPPAGNDNWTEDSGWLGNFGGNLAVGVVVGGRHYAKKIVQRFGQGARTIYFPYPKVWNATHSPAANAQGQLLLVYGKNG